MLSDKSFVWAVGNLCALHKIPFDPQLLIRSFTPPYDLISLQTALQSYSFKVNAERLDLQSIHPAAFPVLVILQSTLKSGVQIRSDREQISKEAETKLAIVFKCDKDRVLWIKSEAENPETISYTNFLTQVTGQVLLVSRRNDLSSHDEALNSSREHGRALDPAKNFGVSDSPFGFKWFIPELLKHKSVWQEILLASLAIQIVALATPLATQVIIDKVVVHHTKSTLIVVAMALFIFLLFNAVMSWVRQYMVLHTGNRIDAVLAHKVFGHLLHLPMRYFEHRPTGVLIARLHGVETIREFLAGSLITFLLDFPFLLVFLFVMFWYSWQLTLISLVSLGLITIVSCAVTPLLRKRLNEQFLLGARNQAFLTEYISGMETVKALQLEPQLEHKYGDYLATYLNSTFKAKQLSNSYNISANALDQLQTLAIICVGAWIVMHDNQFTIGMLVAFQMFSGKLSGPVLRLVSMYQEFQQADIAVKRLGDLMNAPAEPSSLVPVRANTIQGKLDFEGISFRYSEKHPWLYQHLNISINSQKCTVITGPSGCGKSTLAKLMLGFLQPQEGSIKLDGKDIRYMSANELRTVFGVVPQETTLFSGTLYENLTLAHPHAGFEQIIMACELAGIHETIEQLPKGYQTILGEHGTGLSGGQKQRIAIARALLRQPSILIFDEAVSNLDSHSSEAFAQTINKLKGKVTIVFITHQLPKGLQVDEIIEMDRQLKVARY
jgi:ATP-binding cassette, subfamily B, bacterial HlyB/CyaB